MSIAWQCLVDDFFKWAKSCFFFHFQTGINKLKNTFFASHNPFVQMSANGVSNWQLTFNWLFCIVQVDPFYIPAIWAILVSAYLQDCIVSIQTDMELISQEIKNIHFHLLPSRCLLCLHQHLYIELSILLFDYFYCSWLHKIWDQT